MRKMSSLLSAILLAMLAFVVKSKGTVTMESNSVNLSSKASSTLGANCIDRNQEYSKTLSMNCNV